MAENWWGGALGKAKGCPPETADKPIIGCGGRRMDHWMALVAPAAQIVDGISSLPHLLSAHDCSNCLTRLSFTDSKSHLDFDFSWYHVSVPSTRLGLAFGFDAFTGVLRLLYNVIFPPLLVRSTDDLALWPVLLLHRRP
ncbi:uncharacterized protein BP01DRAFT_198217 [Aspergillus saccharolyticus JOP 1030-1]|uniref:Uncharacterized protein n=1 Tax=Aspergillus saccharolyticus JOP 1030-1 TaxID=1450539 RepID=A0A318ZLN7_9EURO|nr:hypothetical protein BP01DRAFT_198217 [Aspergillus saccharolyticus JOP 1030-1]PYH47807.1 hypothetical protein BP01DRAFT_198217 [Aspergillus saccharolyticus JOP 1030-1]